MSTPAPAPRTRMPAFLRGARAAVTLLTRVPVGGFPYGDADWRWAAAHFPLVGAGLGLLAAAILNGLSAASGSVALGAAGALAALLLLTGALHEDGLADTADALGGAHERAQIFVILKDSRIGAFGAAALGMSLILRVSALAALGRHAGEALVLAATVSRVAPVWLMARLPYVTPSETARSTALSRARTTQALVATGSATVWLWLFTPGLPAGPTAWAALVVLGATLLCGWRFYRRAGGVTGDFLGAAQQITEIAALVTLACTLRR